MPFAGQVRVAPLVPTLFADPLAFLSAEHARQRAILAHLERLARAPSARGARAMAGALLHWLACDLPMHVADEEVSLFPRLRPHDGAGMLDRLLREHCRDGQLARALVAELALIDRGTQPGPAFSRHGAAFARLHRHHLRTEEAMVGPLARSVLTEAEREDIAAEIAVRRRQAVDGWYERPA